MFQEMNMTLNLEDFRVKQLPPSIYYIPDFITKEEEEYLIRQVYAAPKPKWTQLSNRRLQNWGGVPQPKGMITEPLPAWLETYCKKIQSLGIFKDNMPNHVLVNEYEAGQGIMPHTDGPLYFPVVSNITLGCHTVLDFYHNIEEQGPSQNGEEQCENIENLPKTSLEDRYFGSVVLQPRSLILTMDEMYSKHLHGIAERTEDKVTDKIANLQQTDVKIGDTLQRTTRVSLTIRYVPKVFKAKFKFGK